MQQMLRRKTRRRQARAIVESRQRARGTMSTQPMAAIGFQKILRVLTASLPMIVSGKSVNLLGIFNLGFNLYKTVYENTSYYTGAYCMFNITPGCLIKQSSLLAQDGLKYSFPGHPISVKFLSAVVHSTVSLSSYAGKWAAVFIPFRENHDHKHYEQVIEKLTFDEIASMPYAVSGPTFSDLKFSYKMRDRTAYCARPRELNEAIGLVAVAWDNAARDTNTSAPTNASFNCEMEIRAGFQPHVIFGPQHRVTYDGTVFEPICLTKGDKVMTTYHNGERRIEMIDWAADELAHMITS